MNIGDTVKVDGRGYTAVIQEAWENGNEIWYTLDRELGDDFRVSYEWPEKRLVLTT